ncbi:hypothetical protein Pmani_009488 [Petrolisthes manimaculis]|uniref:Ionotropic glutamate receptor L-glutamate and glycine-binding domain-containing protein n=1 Tax=Petrolisthes manimaculis TaxID=1843537 RepID=A0AAE1Q452_9EUCA|nr:hypothetical protein Pmani_009488 [Petrolisthes manimaculis]
MVISLLLSLYGGPGARGQHQVSTRQERLHEDPNPSCLRIITAPAPTFMVIKGRPPNNYTFSGLIVEVIDILAKKLNFCYEFSVPAKRNVYGRLLENGTWTSMMGQIQRKEVDMGGTIFSVTWIRSQYFDFSEMLMVDEFNVMTARPEVTSDLAGFVKPFSYSVWGGVVVGSVAVLGATWAVLQGYTRHIRLSEETAAGRSTWLTNLEKSAWWVWCVLMAQNEPWVPWGKSLCVMGSLWLLAAFLLGTVYRCNLKAMLIIPRLFLPFDSLEELVNNGITTVVFRGSSIHGDIEAATSNSTLGKFRKQMLLFEGEEVSKFIPKCLSGMYACLALQTAVTSVLEWDFSTRGRCSAYMMSRGFMGPIALSFAFPKGSQLKHKIDPVIRSLREFGLINKLVSDLMVNGTECLHFSKSSAANTNTLRPLNLPDFYGVLSLYVAGLVAATWVFILEKTVLIKT